MHILLDHLTAILIAAFVAMIIVASQALLGETELDQQLYEISRRQSQAFVQQVEGDLPNIGYRVPSSQPAIERWTDSTFAFRRRADTTASAPVILVEYRRAVVDSATVDDARVPVFEVQRFVDGARSGGSPPSLLSYSLRLLDDAGDPTAQPADAHAVRVRFNNAFASRTNRGDAGDARYARTYYPANLAD